MRRFIRGAIRILIPTGIGMALGATLVTNPNVVMELVGFLGFFGLGVGIMLAGIWAFSEEFE